MDDRYETIIYSIDKKGVEALLESEKKLKNGEQRDFTVEKERLFLKRCQLFLELFNQAINSIDQFDDYTDVENYEYKKGDRNFNFRNLLRTKFTNSYELNDYRLFFHLKDFDEAKKIINFKLKDYKTKDPWFFVKEEDERKKRVNIFLKKENIDEHTSVVYRQFIDILFSIENIERIYMNKKSNFWQIKKTQAKSINKKYIQ
jgi:hypothetical protein